MDPINQSSGEHVIRPGESAEGERPIGQAREGMRAAGTTGDLSGTAPAGQALNPVGQNPGEDITQYTEPHESEEPIGQVHKGMKVVDAAGDEIGKVSEIKMGDPQAITDTGEWAEGTGWDIGLFGQQTEPGTTAEAADPTIGGASGGRIAEPAVPAEIAARLIREGYIKIDGKGWFFDTDRYAPAWVIQSVTGDTVHLSVDKDKLPQAR